MECLVIRTIPTPKISSKIFYRLASLLVHTFCLVFYFSRTSVIHVGLYSHFSMPSLVILKLLARKKMIYEVTSPDVATRSLTSLFARRPYLYDLVVTVSPSVTKKLLQHHGNSYIKIHQRQRPFSLASPISDADIEGKRNLVVYAHRLIERKNPLLACQAFEKLSQKYPDWDFEIYGNGELEDQVSESVKNSNQPNFRYAGYANGMNKILKSSKIFVSLIFPDNYPSQSVIEALANDNSLVLSNVGDTPVFFHEKQVSELVEFNVDSVCHGVEYFIKLDGDLQRNGKSLTFFQERFDYSSYVDDSLSIYEMSGNV